MLRVLEGALIVSEYTDKVDIFSYRANKLGRIQQQLVDMFAILSGMLVAAEGKRGQDLVKDQSVGDNMELFAAIFEVGRRFKVMNPDKMRSTYGKLMFMLQDAQAPEMREAMNAECVRSIVTVRVRAARAQSVRRPPLSVAGARPFHEVCGDVCPRPLRCCPRPATPQVETELASLGAEALLDETELLAAMAPVEDSGAAEAKAEAMRTLTERYGGDDAKRRARIERVLVSIADDEALVRAAPP